MLWYASQAGVAGVCGDFEMVYSAVNLCMQA